ncbi:unnamed protein product [Schistocephalus solidus]|uniref:Uncharacterized protein n=1 Tax=Schistocephalus solidus TaxID=70667 RepID=A0A183SRL5_SCHSO|nr:unnamed protein product [Schistocephalus solidus]
MSGCMSIAQAGHSHREYGDNDQWKTFPRQILCLTRAVAAHGSPTANYAVETLKTTATTLFPTPAVPSKLLGETRFSHRGQLEERSASYIFASGRPQEERRDAGVAFAIQTDIVERLNCLPQGINGRLMSLHLPLRGDNHDLHFSNELAQRLANLPVADKDAGVVPNEEHSSPPWMSSAAHVINTRTGSMKKTKPSAISSPRRTDCIKPTFTALPTQTKQPSIKVTTALLNSDCGKCRTPG